MYIILYRLKIATKNFHSCRRSWAAQVPQQTIRHKMHQFQRMKNLLLRHLTNHCKSIDIPKVQHSMVVTIYTFNPGSKIVFVCQNPHVLLKIISWCNQAYPDANKNPRLTVKPGIGHVKNNYCLKYFRTSGPIENNFESPSIVDFILSNGYKMVGSAQLSVHNEKIWFVSTESVGQSNQQSSGAVLEEQKENAPEYNNALNISVTNQ